MPRKSSASAKSLNAAVEKGRRAAIDELGSLQAELAVVEPKRVRAEALKKIVRGFAADVDPAHCATFHGDKFAAVLTAQTEESQIDLARVYTRVGHKAFLAAVSMSLKSLEGLIPAEEERAAFLSKARTGSRRVSTVALAC
jgi:hypothetical protein